MRNVVFHSLFYFVVMLPVIQLVPVSVHFIADRYHYVPSIGLFALAGLGFAYLYGLARKNAFLKSALIAVLVAVIGTFSFLSFKRCAVWERPESVLLDITEKYPTYYAGHNALGLHYLNVALSKEAEDEKQEYIRMARKEFETSLECKPRNYTGLVGLGRALCQTGNYEEAEDLIRTALGSHPEFAEGYFHLATVYDQQGKFEEAILNYSKAIDRDAGDLRYYLRRAFAYVQVEAYQNARDDLNRVLSLNPPDETRTVVLEVLETIEGK
jgi:tetratricopeptide (TPR) repeat protein